MIRYRAYYINEQETIHTFTVKAAGIIPAIKEAHEVMRRKQILQGHLTEFWKIIKIEEVE